MSQGWSKSKKKDKQKVQNWPWWTICEPTYWTVVHGQCDLWCTSMKWFQNLWFCSEWKKCIAGPDEPYVSLHTKRWYTHLCDRVLQWFQNICSEIRSAKLAILDVQNKKERIWMANSDIQKTINIDRNREWDKEIIEV